MKIDGNIIDKIVSIKDLDDRINLNLEKDNLTYQQILDDTKKLVSNLEFVCFQSSLQIEIYNRLIQRIRERMIKEDSSFKKG